MNSNHNNTSLKGRPKKNDGRKCTLKSNKKR